LLGKYDYLRVDVLAKTIQGRNVDILTITHPRNLKAAAANDSSAADEEEEDESGDNGSKKHYEEKDEERKQNNLVVDRAPKNGARASPELFVLFARACASLGSSPTQTSP
jgi:hypothetical protein